MGEIEIIRLGERLEFSDHSMKEQYQMIYPILFLLTVLIIRRIH